MQLSLFPLQGRAFTYKPVPCPLTLETHSPREKAGEQAAGNCRARWILKYSDPSQAFHQDLTTQHILILPRLWCSEAGRYEPHVTTDQMGLQTPIVG